MLHLDYGNDDSVNYNYDDQGRLILETFEDGDTVSYTYNSYGNLATVMDSETGITTAHYYDFIDRLVKYRETGGGRSHSVNYIYDSENNLSQLKETIDGTVHTTDYGYNKDNRVTSVTNGTASEHYTYDGLGRIDRIVTTNTAANAEVLEKSYTFRNPSATTTSTQIATNSIQATIGELTEDDLYYDPDPYVFDVTYSYTYDDNGNILSISDGTNTTSYEYDSANQLIRENNQELGFTHTWEYDNVGNILNRKEYAYTTGSLDDLEPEEAHEMSGYGMRAMGDLFAEYDGVVMSYDAIGNPLYDGEWTYTWEHGRELKTMSRGGYDNWSFAYDANGMRTRRTHPDIEYQYIYNGSQLSQLTVLETGGGGLAVNVLYFTYSADGTPLTVTSEGQLYFYVTNMQGDVIAILDDTGRVVCRYIYDAWGNVTTDSWTTDLVVYHNPLRYRGYVYDEETGLYYLQSRYYNPEWGRFLNADAFVSTGQGVLGNNMFAYCYNNPIAFVDSTGQFPWFAVIIIAVCTVAGGVIGYNSNEKLWEAPKKQDNTNVKLPNKNPEKAQSENPNAEQEIEDNTLTRDDKLKNTLIGASVGLAIGGGIVATSGAIGSVATGSATTYIAALGGTGKQTFAIGALAYDIWAVVIAPFLGVEVEPIEYAP